MQTIKEEALRIISRLPKTANLDDIVYELYVVDKVNKGREAARSKQTMSADDLKKEILTW